MHVQQHVSMSGFIQAGLSKIQGLLKDFLRLPTVFQGLKFMKHIHVDLSVKILLQKY